MWDDIAVEMTKIKKLKNYIPKKKPNFLNSWLTSSLIKEKYKDVD